MILLFCGALVELTVFNSSDVRAVPRSPMAMVRLCYELTGILQTKLNAGFSKQQQEDLFQIERSFHEVKL